METVARDRAAVATVLRTLLVLAAATFLVAAALGAGPRTELNDVYHQVILVALPAGLWLLVTPEARAALRRGNIKTSPG